LLNTKTSKTQIITSIDTASIERAFEEACFGNLQITHRLKLRRLVTSLWFNTEMNKQEESHQNHIEPLRALTNFKANLKRRKKTSDTLTSYRLMEIPEPARAILLADIAYIFRDEIDDYTQIDFSNARHVGLLSIAVDNGIFKVSNRQGRPVNEPLDEFFIGLRDLYEAATGKKAIAKAHYSNQPKTEFEQLIYLGYQIIRPAQNYDAAYKAYERAISRNSQTTE
jgi:hypothetical protein